MIPLLSVAEATIPSRPGGFTPSSRAYARVSRSRTSGSRSRFQARSMFRRVSPSEAPSWNAASRSALSSISARLRVLPGSPFRTSTREIKRSHRSSQRAESGEAWGETIEGESKNLSADEVVGRLEDAKIANARTNTFREFSRPSPARSPRPRARGGFPGRFAACAVPPVTMQGVESVTRPIPDVGQHAADILEESWASTPKSIRHRPQRDDLNGSVGNATVARLRTASRTLRIERAAPA